MSDSILKSLRAERAELLRAINKLDKAIAIFDGEAVVEKVEKKKHNYPTTRGPKKIGLDAIPAAWGDKGAYMVKHVTNFLRTRPNKKAHYMDIVEYLKKNNLVKLPDNGYFALGPYLSGSKQLKFLGKGVTGGWLLKE